MQVWMENKHVGNLNLHVDLNRRNVLFEFRNVEFDDPLVTTKPLWDLPVTSKQIVLEVERMSRRVGLFDLELSRRSETEILVEMGIPLDDKTLEKHKDFHHDALVFTWKVLKVKPEDYETIFDMDKFEPV